MVSLSNPAAVFCLFGSRAGEHEAFPYEGRRRRCDRSPAVLKSYASGRVFGEAYGDGSPQVLAMHGWGRDRHDFREVLRGLEAVAIDLPGFGASPEPERATGTAGYAEMAEPVLDHCAENAVVVGHSFGGRVAVRLAGRRPGRIGALVLVAAPLLRRWDATARGVPVGYRIIRRLHTWGVLDQGRLERARRRYGSADYRNAQGVMRDVLVAAVNETYEEELAALRLPVHLVWGADDREVPVEIAERSMDLLAYGSLTVLPGVGHHVCIEAPEAVRAAVLGAVG